MLHSLCPVLIYSPWLTYKWCTTYTLTLFVCRQLFYFYVILEDFVFLTFMCVFPSWIVIFPIIPAEWMEHFSKFIFSFRNFDPLVESASVWKVSWGMGSGMVSADATLDAPRDDLPMLWLPWGYTPFQEFDCLIKIKDCEIPQQVLTWWDLCPLLWVSKWSNSMLRRFMCFWEGVFELLWFYHGSCVKYQWNFPQLLSLFPHKFM